MRYYRFVGDGASLSFYADVTYSVLVVDKAEFCGFVVILGISFEDGLVRLKCVGV
jgi:hypothetical protein